MREIGLHDVCGVVGVPLSKLKAMARRTEKHVRQFTLSKISSSGGVKERPVAQAQGLLERVHDRLLHQLFPRALERHPASHGGVPGRSVKTNAEPHRHSIYALTADVKDFYPSIRSSDVAITLRKAGFDKDSSGLLAELCTVAGELKQGLKTSSALSDAYMHGADSHAQSVLARNGLVYTRFVDDITVSGGDSAVVRASERLLAQSMHRRHLQLHPDKTRCDLLSELSVAGVRIMGERLSHRPDQQTKFMNLLAAEVAAAAKGDWCGAVALRRESMGLMHFALWLDRRTGRPLLQIMRHHAAKLECIVGPT